MPARNLQRINKEGAYLHIFNRGISKGDIFNDKQDYETFLKFLKNYLSPLLNSDEIKTSFTVKGRTYRGIPHQLKNYYNQVELIAYSIRPNHFHLLLHQINEGSVEKFMRSLSTRYSMYFNNKNKRTGSLFDGPYKSIQINDTASLLYLSHYFHKIPYKSNNYIDNYTSYESYINYSQSSWIKPRVVLSFFDKSKGKIFKGISNYQGFINKYSFNKEEKKILERITIEDIYEHLEGSEPLLVKRDLKADHAPIKEPKQKLRIPEYFSAAFMFVILFSFGLRNVIASTANPNVLTLPSINKITNVFTKFSEKLLDDNSGEISGVEDQILEKTKSPLSSQPPKLTNISGVEDEIPQVTQGPSSSPSAQLSGEASGEVAGVEEKMSNPMVVINIGESTDNVNIRQSPTTDSEIVGKAVNGDYFEFISEDSGWYEIQLTDGSTGFISEQYAELIEEEN